MSTSSITTSSCFAASVYDRLDALPHDTDSRSVAEALGYPRRSGVVSSPQDRLRRGMDWEPLRVSVIERGGDTDDSSKSSMIATLLVCPNLYTTPWQAACYSIQHDLDPLPVEYFFQQVFAAWMSTTTTTTTSHTPSSNRSYDNSNTTTPTARDALTGCVEALLTAPPRQQGILASILLHCSATSDSHHHQQQQLLDHVLNVIFAKDAAAVALPEQLWETTLATPTQFWRPREYRIARQRILRTTTTATTACCSPGRLVALAARQGRRSGAAWTALVVRAMAQQTPATRCAAEQSLRDALDRLPSAQLVEWQQQTMMLCWRDDETEKVQQQQQQQPAWAEAIVLLLLRDRVDHTQPDMVSLFVRLALTHKGPRKDPPPDTTRTSTIWDRILRLANCHDMNCDLVDRMMESEESSEYLGSGVFANNKELSLMGSFVFKTLFYGRKPTRKDRSDAAMIAKCWIQAACARQQSETQPDAASVAALVTVYMEVPVVRALCIETVLHCLELKGRAGDRISYIVSVFVGIIVASVLEGATCRLSGTDTLDHIGALAVALRVPLPTRSFCELARSLAAFDAARVILLDIFKRVYSTVHLVRQGSKEEDDVKRGFVAALMLLSRPVWDKPQCKAWGLLSTIIVDNNPHVCFPLRQWMFGYMKQAIVRGWFCDESCQRLFAACASRIFGYISAGTENASFCFQKMFVCREHDTMVQTEAMLELFDLTTCAYNRIGPSSTVRSHDILRCLIEPGRPKFPYNSKLPLALVFDAVLVSLFLALAQKETQTHGLHRVAYKVIAKADREVKQIESDFCSKFQIDQAPRWVLDKNLARVDFPGKESALLEQEIGQLQSGLVDVVLGLLLGSPNSRLAGAEQVTSSFAAAFLIGEVLERRRMAQSQQQQGPCERCSLHIDGFCSIFAPALRAAVEGHFDSFQHVGSVLSAVKNFCGMVQASPGVNPADKMSLQGQIASIWKLYQAGFNEASSLKLVAVLELHVASPDPFSRTGSIQLTRHDDVDFIIQRLRLSVVELLFEQLSVLVDLKDPTRGGLGLIENEMIPVCLQIVSQLSSDLCSGLRGSSGGLTHDLFAGKCDKYKICCDSNALAI